MYVFNENIVADIDIFQAPTGVAQFIQRGRDLQSLAIERNRAQGVLGLERTNGLARDALT